MHVKRVSYFIHYIKANFRAASAGIAGLARLSLAGNGAAAPFS
jgi:hypothetical protein